MSWSDRPICGTFALLSEISLAYHSGFLQLVGPDFKAENRQLLEKGFASRFTSSQPDRAYLCVALSDSFLPRELVARTFLTFVAWQPPAIQPTWRAQRNVALVHMNDIFLRQQLGLVASIVEGDTLLIQGIAVDANAKGYVAQAKKQLLAAA